jgi:molecular chaperone GrpE
MVHERSDGNRDGRDGRAAVADVAASAGAASDLLDQLQRERADFRNYKRRAEQERATDRARERADVVAQLLPLLDDLDRALAQLPAELAGNSWARGVAIGRSQLASAIDRLGLERIGFRGEPFDPARHEAQSFEERPDLTTPVVVRVVRPGYRIGGRLVRPALVDVAGPPRAPSSPTPAAQQEMDPWQE